MICTYFLPFPSLPLLIVFFVSFQCKFPNSTSQLLRSSLVNVVLILNTSLNALAPSTPMVFPFKLTPFMFKRIIITHFSSYFYSLFFFHHTPDSILSAKYCVPVLHLSLQPPYHQCYFLFMLTLLV